MRIDDADHPEIPNRTGKVYDIDKFDATFFSVYHKQAENMDPIGRILLEKAYETIIDAGMCGKTHYSIVLIVYTCIRVVYTSLS